MGIDSEPMPRRREPPRPLFGRTRCQGNPDPGSGNHRQLRGRMDFRTGPTHAWKTYKDGKMLPLAFAALGFLVGNLTGLSASPIAAALVPALFTLVGGSFIAFFPKTPEHDRRLAAQLILVFFSCMFGRHLLGNCYHFLRVTRGNRHRYRPLFEREMHFGPLSMRASGKRPPVLRSCVVALILQTVWKHCLQRRRLINQLQLLCEFSER